MMIGYNRYESEAGLGAVVDVLVLYGTVVGDDESVRIVLGPLYLDDVTFVDEFAVQDGSLALDALAAVVDELFGTGIEMDAVGHDVEGGRSGNEVVVTFPDPLAGN